jgi:O-succinylbenzoic acid--CoA ligase
MEITHISMVPTQLIRIMDNRAGSCLSGMKAVLLGGDSVPAGLITRAIEKHIPLITSYGSTEMSSQVTATMPGDSLSHIFTSGKLLPYRELMIDDDGEILVRGATLFKGYVNGEETTEAINGNWFHTGDLGFLDKDGYLTVTGRKDNMFISGGENIQPEQVEREILRLGRVAQTIVVSVKDYEYGNRPVAFIMMKDNALLDPVQIRDELTGRLPKFMIPVSIYPWPNEFEQKGIKIKRQYFKKLAQRLASLSADR